MELDRRKSVHVKLLSDTHANFRIASFKLKLSMQEMFEEFAQRVIAEDPKVMKILSELSDRKKEKLVKKLSKSDVTTLLDIIDSESPYSQDL
jgi:histidyl-tRNA synthetase